jgi:hypothetical protein
VAEAVNTGRYRDESTIAAERYGRHSQAHADVPVVDVLQATVDRGDPLRLAWSPDQIADPVKPTEEFPTAVLPVVNTADKSSDHTEPLPPPDTRQQSVRARDFSWWPTVLAG